MDPHIQGWNPTAAPQGQGVQRLITTIGLWKAAGLFSAGALFMGLIGQEVLPAPHRPGDVIGDLFGSIYAGELNAARPALIATTQQTADAQAMAQAKAQQQVLAAQSAQQYGLMTAMPSIVGSWVAQGMCLYGHLTGDQKLKQNGCGAAQQLNNSINQQAGAAMDNLGTTRAWTGAPPPSPSPPVITSNQPPASAGALQAIAPLPGSLQEEAADAGDDNRPLSDAEEGRIVRWERRLPVADIQDARLKFNLHTNGGRRKYLGALFVIATNTPPEKLRQD